MNEGEPIRGPVEFNLGARYICPAFARHLRSVPQDRCGVGQRRRAGLAGVAGLARSATGGGRYLKRTVRRTRSLGEVVTSPGVLMRTSPKGTRT